MIGLNILKRKIEMLANRLYNDRKTKDFSINDLVILKMDRKKIFVILEDELNG